MAEIESLSQEVNEHSRWIAAHDAKGDVLWEEQRRVNQEVKEGIDKIWTKLDSIQVKLGVITGAAGVIGGLLGTLMAKVFVS